MMSTIPDWMSELEHEDWQFIHRFILASGSLKQLAEGYSVSYPTVRARLDRLIAKVQAAEAPGPRDPFERKVSALVADGKLPTNIAKDLLSLYQNSKNSTKSSGRTGAKS